MMFARPSRGTLALACVAATAVHAQARMPLVLNHLTIVLDSATYHDVVGSPFIRTEFGAIDTTAMRTSRQPGLVLIGKYDYLAFAGAQTGTHDAVGDVDIVLGVEQVGALDQVARKTRLNATTRAEPDNSAGFEPAYEEAWSSRLTPSGNDATSPHVLFAIVQYSARAAAARSATDSLPADDVRAARFLAPYFDRTRLFSQLTGATLAIPVEDIRRISRILARDSIPVVAEGEGAIISLSGFTLRLVPPWSGGGVKQLQFALTRSALANPVYRFGPRSRLRFGPGPVAVWDFTGQ